MKLPAPLQMRWDAAAPREQRAVRLALCVLGCALLWWLGVAPALARLHTARVQTPLLERQHQTLLGLQAQARALQARPPLALDEASRQLEAAVRQHLGPTTPVALAGDRATVTLTGVSAPALAQWLAQVRLNARAVPDEAHLVRNPGGTWDGSLVLSLGGH